MKGKYEIIKQIIDIWEAFEDEAFEEHNLLNFSKWLIEKINDDSIENIKLEPKGEKFAISESSQYIEKLDLKTRFQEYIFKIARFEEFYIRKYLVDLPINSRLEYTFLYTINRYEEARKTELINIHLVEYTTGMDTIRRLIKNGLLYESQDKKDKRAKLLKLTKHGQEILNKANSRIEESRNMFLACVSPNKWKKTLPVLREIEEFHTDIYINHYDKPYPELSNLMDSLKHLYK
ncbi:MAG TPA: MarR family winged helix-turn-helix transcriptional regulator [Bacteroidales bacterium]|nr:MarR family winged helix-turn-helix transcriptional regulator [Bacteroidales bacterium]